jgi:hypothetical protein
MILAQTFRLKAERLVEATMTSHWRIKSTKSLKQMHEIIQRVHSFFTSGTLSQK